MNMERINIHKADLPVTERSADYALLVSDAGSEVQFNTAAEALTATLPSAPEADNGYMAVIRNTGANSLTVAAPAGGTVDGAASITVNPQQSVWLRCDGLAWKTIAFGGCVSGYVPDADPGRAKAWASISGVGTISVLAGYNLSTITDNGVGDYSFSWASPMNSVNYAPLITVGSYARFNEGSNYNSTSITAAGLEVHTSNANISAPEDVNGLSVVSLGDLA